MKADIHPDYHEITVVMTDGTEFKTRSTYGKPGDKLELQVDPKSHPAWTGGTQKLLDQGGRMARFNQRFGVKTKPAEPKAAPKAAEKAEEKAPEKAPAKEAEPKA